MRLVVDCRYVRIGRHDGISRFTASLVAELGGLHDLTMLIDDRRQLANLPALPWELVRSATSPLEPLVARQVNRLRPDVVFSPMQTMGSWGREYRLVLTVHDLIYYTHRTPPRDLPGFVRVLWRLYHLAWWPQRLLLNRADGIVAVSETTRRLIGDRRLTRNPVAVVTNAAEPVPAELAPRIDGRISPVSKTLVYMGSFMPYKNVDALARAMASLPDYELLLMSRVDEAERARLASLAPDARLTFLGGASDDVYREALLRATALVTASRDEGFGIPVIEAMALGTPAVVSDIPIFREVGGAGALFVDPDDPAGFAAAVRSLEDDATWQRLSRAGRRAAAAFDWATSARDLLAFLTRVAEEPRRGRRALE